MASINVAVTESTYAYTIFCLKYGYNYRLYYIKTCAKVSSYVPLHWKNLQMLQNHFNYRLCKDGRRVRPVIWRHLCKVAPVHFFSLSYLRQAETKLYSFKHTVVKLSYLFYNPFESYYCCAGELFLFLSGRYLAQVMWLTATLTVALNRWKYTSTCRWMSGSKCFYALFKVCIDQAYKWRFSVPFEDGGRSVELMAWVINMYIMMHTYNMQGPL